MRNAHNILALTFDEITFIEIMKCSASLFLRRKENRTTRKDEKLHWTHAQQARQSHIKS
jgi:hypothetical protein